MLLFFDCETSGLPDFNKRASDPSQPHIVQLAAMLTDDSGEVFESHNVIVKPEAWTISPEMADIHGITHAIAAAVGLPENTVAGLLFEMIRKADLVVAHNVQFDKFMARILMRRARLLTDDLDGWWKGLNTFCTMRASTELCQLPGKFPGQFKFPKLAEAYQHLFAVDLDNAHDALADVTACMEIYFALKRRDDLEMEGAPA
ncbi:MAG: 3'-5' exonuclease [Patescibacteria group bacterium]|nr:3'-5' exonuclease [Patescibacteria group bacterium]